MNNGIKIIISMIVITISLYGDVENKKYFIGLSTGSSKMDVTQNDKIGSISIGTPLDNKGSNFNIELGYRYNLKYFSTISYSLIKYNDIKLHNYLVSYNKVFDNQYNPYLGLVGGVSYIELTKSHINSSLPDEKGRKFAIGVQGGLEINIDKNLDFFFQYQYLKAKHITIVESSPARSEFARDNHSNLSIGIRWIFVSEK